MSLPPVPAIFGFDLTVPPEAIDENGHVNNVAYVQWMQVAAMRHYAALGGVEPLRALNATWVVRAHQIEYLAPAFAGELLEVRTWVMDLRRVRSLRRYEFLRQADGKLLAKDATDWVLVSAQTGRPLAIPAEVAGLFSLVPDPQARYSST